MSNALVKLEVKNVPFSIVHRFWTFNDSHNSTNVETILRTTETHLCTKFWKLVDALTKKENMYGIVSKEVEINSFPIEQFYLYLPDDVAKFAALRSRNSVSRIIYPVSDRAAKGQVKIYKTKDGEERDYNSSIDKDSALQEVEIRKVDDKKATRKNLVGGECTEMIRVNELCSFSISVTVPEEYKDSILSMYKKDFGKYVDTEFDTIQKSLCILDGVSILDRYCKDARRKQSFPLSGCWMETSIAVTPAA